MNSGLISGLDTVMSHKIPARHISPSVGGFLISGPKPNEFRSDFWPRHHNISQNSCTAHIPISERFLISGPKPNEFRSDFWPRHRNVSQNSCKAPQSEVSSFLGQNLMNSGLISGLGTIMSHKIPARHISPQSEVSSFLGQNLKNSSLISGLGTKMSHKIRARPLSPWYLHSWAKT
jgi:hypothetical protein